MTERRRIPLRVEHTDPHHCTPEVRLEVLGRVPFFADLTPEERSEIEHTLRRVADKLLHEQTVRIKQLAGRIPESSYAEAVAELFALDPAAVEAVTRAGEKE